MKGNVVDGVLELGDKKDPRWMEDYIDEDQRQWIFQSTTPHKTVPVRML